MAKVWIFDIDGTIADLGHRLHYINGKPKSWSRFFGACGDDKPIEQTLSLIRTLQRDGQDFIFLSGRPESCKSVTVFWLKEQGITVDDGVKIYMRPTGNTEPDTKIKWKIMQKLLSDGFEPIAIFEDRKCMVDMWRSKGFFVFDVNQSGKDY